MRPTTIYFEQALSAPKLYFRRLRQIEPILCNGRPIVKCTHHAIESEIIWDGRHYLLSLPFERTSISHIEQLEEISRERSTGPLIPTRILYDELTTFDSLGHKHYFDVVLQEIPDGTMLKDALHIFKREDIRNAIIIMKKRLDNIGFCHNNLRPYNIIICKSGVARPLRYWYAIWETFSNNNISQLLETIDAHTDIKEEFYLRPLVLNDDMAEYNTSIIYEGIKRKYLGGRYGFIDEDGNRITKYTYSQASEFREGRALVATNNKWGVINDHGRKIVAEIYHSMEFDISTASFIATRDNYRYIIDYNGNIIHRTDME